jgi:hypothetical protein
MDKYVMAGFYVLFFQSFGFMVVVWIDDREGPVFSQHEGMAGWAVWDIYPRGTFIEVALWNLDRYALYFDGREDAWCAKFWWNLASSVTGVVFFFLSLHDVLWKTTKNICRYTRHLLGCVSSPIYYRMCVC